MADIKKPDEEMFFHRLEMRSQAASEGRVPSFMIRAYDLISNFGNSIFRPLVTLTAIIFLGWQFMVFWIQYKLIDANPKVDGLLWSLSNSLPLVKPSFELSNLPSFLKLFSAFQSIVGAILLFLVLLAIRNKFRIK